MCPNHLLLCDWSSRWPSECAPWSVSWTRQRRRRAGGRRSTATPRGSWPRRGRPTGACRGSCSSSTCRQSTSTHVWHEPRQYLGGCTTILWWVTTQPVTVALLLWYQNTSSFCHCPSNRRKETLTIRQTLDNLRLDLSVDDEDEDKDKAENQQETSVTNV